jgi:cysteine desulfurase
MNVSREAWLRDCLERELLALIPDCEVNGFGSPRLPNTTNIGFKYSGIHFHSVHGIRGGVGAAPPARGSAPAPLLNQLAYRYISKASQFSTC